MLCAISICSQQSLNIFIVYARGKAICLVISVLCFPLIAWCKHEDSEDTISSSKPKKINYWGFATAKDVHRHEAINYQMNMFCCGKSSNPPKKQLVMATFFLWSPGNHHYLHKRIEQIKNNAENSTHSRQYSNLITKMPKKYHSWSVSYYMFLPSIRSDSQANHAQSYLWSKWRKKKRRHQQLLIVRHLSI